MPPKAALPLHLLGASDDTEDRLSRNRELIGQLGGVYVESIVKGVGSVRRGAAEFLIDEALFVLPLEEAIDIDKECARLVRKLADIEGEIGKLEKRLANSDFVARAPEDVIEEQRKRHEEAVAARAKLVERLARLGEG